MCMMHNVIIGVNVFSVLRVTVLCLTGCEVPQQDVGSKCQSIHILCCCGKHLPSLHQSSTAGLCLTGSLNGRRVMPLFLVHLAKMGITIEAFTTGKLEVPHLLIK